MIIEGMTYKQVEKSMAAMRKDVLAWKKQLKQEDGSIHRNNALHENFKSFEGTFKAARVVLGRPEDDFPMESKRKKLETCYVELQKWYTAIQFLMRPKPMKKEAEIKQEDEPKKTSNKKTIEIKEEEQLQISIRGGRRAGAGRKSIGVKKAVSIALPEKSWNEIDNLIQSGKFKSYSEFFRSMVLNKK